jgi:hypothetical protein
VSYNPLPGETFGFSTVAAGNLAGSAAESLVESPKEILRISFLDENGNYSQAFV